MRFKKYLTEGVQDKLIDQIQPFLKEFREQYKDGNFIYRGISSVQGGVKLKKARKDRKPKLIHQELHELLGEYTKELFGWNVRSEGVFTGDRNTAEEYGRSFIFIPKGNYEYIWVSEDKQFEIYNLYDEITSSLKSGKNILNIESSVDELKTLYKNYRSDRLNNYLEKNRNFEAIFRCDEYFIIDPNYWEKNNIGDMI